MLSSVKNDVRCAVISATDFQQKQPIKFLSMQYPSSFTIFPVSMQFIN